MSTLQDTNIPDKSEKTYHHDDLRTALIIAGLAVLREENVAGLTLRKVARRAQVSHAAPYRHFADKSELLAAIAEEGFNLLGSALETATTETASAKALFMQAAFAYLTFARQNPDHFQLMFGSYIPNITAYPSLDNAADQSFSRLQLFVERMQSISNSSNLGKERLAIAFWAMLHGIAMLTVEERLPAEALQGENIEEFISGLLEVLWQGVASELA
jgi:AcrR family transcriptional regulator